MYFGNIKEFSVENGTGVRVSLFVSGCRNHCKNCFSTHTWDFKYGSEFNKNVEDHIIDALKPGYITGLSILGGEPFEPENQKELLPFIKRVRKEIPDKTIWMYTGFLYEMFFEESRANTPYVQEILKNIDVLVDGRFEEDKKNLSIKFRGSTNQRIIDVQETIKTGKVVLVEGLMN